MQSKGCIEYWLGGIDLFLVPDAGDAGVFEHPATTLAIIEWCSPPVGTLLILGKDVVLTKGALVNPPLLNHILVDLGAS